MDSVTIDEDASPADELIDGVSDECDSFADDVSFLSSDGLSDAAVTDVGLFVDSSFLLIVDELAD